MPHLADPPSLEGRKPLELKLGSPRSQLASLKFNLMLFFNLTSLSLLVHLVTAKREESTKHLEFSAVT